MTGWARPRPAWAPKVCGWAYGASRISLIIRANVEEWEGFGAAQAPKGNKGRAVRQALRPGREKEAPVSGWKKARAGASSIRFAVQQAGSSSLSPGS